MRLPKTEIPEERLHFAIEQVVKFCTALNPLPKEVLEKLVESNRIVQYRSRDVILNYGQVCDYSMICVDGLVASTVIMDDREKIVWFRGAGEIVVSVNSWYKRTGSEEKLTAVTDTLCAALSYQAIRRLTDLYPEFHRMYTKLIEQEFMMSDQLSIWHQLPTDTKIQELQARYPELLGKVPNTQLASFLGISREGYSRRRHRKTGED